MESAHDLDAERLAMFARLQSIDCAVADVDELAWKVQTSRSLISYLSAHEAESTQWHEQRLAERGRIGPTANGAADDEDDEQAAGSPGDAASGEPEPTPERPAPPDPPESPRDRQRRLLRAKWLKLCRRFAAALRAGRVTISHVDALAAALERLEPGIAADVVAEEADLLLVAEVVTAESFAAHLRRVIDRIRTDAGLSLLQRQLAESAGWVGYDNTTGMYKLWCQLDVERGAAIAAVIQAQIEAIIAAGQAGGMNRRQLVAEAIYRLLTRPTTIVDGDDDAPAVMPEVLYIVDHETLLHGPHEHSVCESNDGAPVPVGLVRSLCGMATITAAVAGADGRTLAVGRCARLANREQRRALRAMYRHCIYPRCRVPFPSCHIHHIEFFDDGGLTDLDNLAPVCFTHHHLIHDGGWRLTIDPQRTLRWYRPDGTIAHTSPFQPLLTPAGRRTSAAATSKPGDPGHSGTAERAPPDGRDAAATSPAVGTPSLFDNTNAA